MHTDPEACLSSTQTSVNPDGGPDSWVTLKPHDRMSILPNQLISIGSVQCIVQFISIKPEQHPGHFAPGEQHLHPSQVQTPSGCTDSLDAKILPCSSQA